MSIAGEPAPHRVARVADGSQERLPEDRSGREVERGHAAAERATFVVARRREGLLLRGDADVDDAVEHGRRLRDDRCGVALDLGLPQQGAGVLVDGHDGTATAERPLVADDERAVGHGRGGPGLVPGDSRVGGDRALPHDGTGRTVDGVEVAGPVRDVHPAPVDGRSGRHVATGRRNHFFVSPPTVAAEIFVSLAAYLVFCRSPPAEFHPFPPGAAAACPPTSRVPAIPAATHSRA